ncbi:nitrilase-related carbon-nitrogen hydrolase [Nonomuraea sp. NPDC050643]|uniref:nitrilase-related carbon-nitrogen hydrolase n=1 Tax=Nonomuraea sp. NPDC050643 TaxID=3155660 RepID=UPI0033D577B4
MKRGLLALSASAVLFYLGTGFAPIPALTWVAPLPVLWLAARVSGRAAFGVAFLAYLLGLAGQFEFFVRTPSVPLPIGMGILAGSSLLFGLVVLLFRALAGRGLTLAAAFGPPAAWVGVEHLITLVNPSGIIWPLATNQAEVPLVTQIASVTGAWGVEFLVLLVPCAVAAMLSPGTQGRERGQDGRQGRGRGRVRTGVVAGLVCALTLGFGAWRLAGADGGTAQRVAVLSATRYQWAPDAGSADGQALARRYAARIASLPPGVRTVVLPEGAFGTSPSTLPLVVGPLTEAGRGRGVDVVVGVVHTTPAIKYNYSVLLPADGSSAVYYAKWHISPGAPFRKGVDLAFARDGRTGLANCMDLNFAAPSRDYGRAGARLLAVPAADEFGNGWQHSRMGLLRGVESGFALAWAAQWGTPMISDAWGRVLASADTEGTRAPFVVAVADVPAGPAEPTLYARFGDWFGWFCVAGVLLLAGVVLVGDRRDRLLDREGDDLVVAGGDRAGAA